MASVTVTLADSAFVFVGGQYQWRFWNGGRPNLGAALSSDGTNRYIRTFALAPSHIINIDLELTDDDSSGSLADLSTIFEMEGEVSVVASDGVSATLDDLTADSTEPYNWPNNAAVGPFITHVNGLSDRAIVVTFDDNQNAAPVVTASASASIVNANGTIQLISAATDPDAVPDTLALQWTANPNIGSFSAPMSLNTNWTAPGNDPNDRQVVFTLTATEPDESLTGSASVNVTVRGNRRPVVTHVADETTVDVGATVTLTATATDPEGEPMTYSRTSDIGGAFTNPTALIATWIAPAVTESTVASLTFSANDGVRTGTAVATVIVRAAATQPLTLPVVAAKSSLSGAVVNETLPEAMQGLTPYIYSATGLPNGLGFRNRRVQGIPVLPGAYTVSYVVTDSNQDMVERTFTWTVTGDIIPQPTGLNMRIDWGNQFYANTHANVTGRMQSGVSCERGRNTASAILGRSQAGQMSFELDNSDGLYDQENPSSDLAGLIRPGIQVQFRDGVTPLWTGVLDSIPTRFEQNDQHRAEVTALGVLSTAIEPVVSGGSLTAESSAQAFIELCAKGDVPSESPQPMPGDAYVMRRWWLISKLREALNVIEDTEGGFIFEDREGELGFHLANYRATRTVGTTFVSTTPGAGELRIVGNPRRELAIKDVHNEVEGAVRQFESKVDETVFSSLDPIAIALGGRLDLVSVYPVSTGAVSELNTLTAGTDWTANQDPDGGGTNRTSQVDIQIELMDFNEVHITITYPTTGGNQFDTVYVRDLTIMGTVITEGTPLRVVREDTVSKERYRPKTLTLGGTWVRSVSDMEARGDAILDLIAEPERRISLDWYVDSWADFISLDLSDRVRVEMPTISSDGFVEGIRLNIPLSGVNPVCTVDVSLVEGGVSMVIPPTPATVPSRPAAPSLVVDSDTQITATGVAPDDGGSPITSYDWRHRVTGSGGAGWVDRSNVTSLVQAFSGLDASTQYDFRFRATNNVGDSLYGLITRATTEATPTTLTAPAFADDTGDDQDWTQDAAITSITVPAATGTPTPAYAAVGSLPAGISFNTTTRVISGTPTAVGSGTITIRATNSQGSDDWVVDYATTAATTGDSVTVPLTGISTFTNYIRWSDNQSLGSTFDANDQEQVLTTLDLNNAGPAGQVFISIVGSDNRFTPEFEATGRIIFEASDGEILEVMIADADMSEAYTWVPTNSAEVVAFVLHVKGLTDQDATLTLSE